MNKLTYDQLHVIYTVDAMKEARSYWAKRLARTEDPIARQRIAGHIANVDQAIQRIQLKTE